ncbi:phosphohydrolase [Candidatus Woesebacteria bacterium]|nr:phosphohydrolase [Candidatus Woesebacteria bacterium]
MTRDEALKLLHEHMESPNLRRHCYAVEAVMKALARYFSQGERSSVAKAMEETWGVVGLLHDGDYEETKQNPEKHTLLMTEWLKKEGVDDREILEAVLSHNYAHTDNNPPKNRMEWSLYCCDELTGLIVAVALVRPDRKLASVTVEAILKKWDERSFAAGVKREQIKQCESRLGIPLNEFIKIALEAMQGIAPVLGL